MPAAGPVMPMTHSDPNEFEPPRADVIEYAQGAHSDLDTQLPAFFEEFRRIDLIYGAYGRPVGCRSARTSSSITSVRTTACHSAKSARIHCCHARR